MKLISGTIRRDRFNPAEPRFSRELPEPPDHLYDEAVAEWKRVAPVLYKSGVLTTVDRTVLAAYCQCYARWIHAEEALAVMASRDRLKTGGLVLQTANGNFVQNPLVGIASRAIGDMVKYAIDLGMTPSSRSRVQALPERNLEDEEISKKYFD